MTSGDRPWRRVLALCSVQLLVALEFSIATVALPGIGQEFRASAQGLQWVLSGYALAYGSLLLCAGRYADVLGPRRLLLWGLGAFTLASLAAAGAPGLGPLVALRIVQGAAAAFATPAALALITSLPAPRDRALALGWWGAGASLGFACGAVLGGVITEALGWPAIFGACAVLAGATLLMVARWVPEHRAGGGAGRPDPASALLLGGCVVAVTAALSPDAVPGWWDTPLILAAGTVCALALRARTRGRRGSADPLVPPGLLARPPVRLANLAGAWAPAAGGSMVFFVTVLMQGPLGWSQSATGLMLLPDAAAAALGARVAGPLHARLGAVRAYGCGLTAVAAGMAVLALTPLGPAAWVFVVVGSCLTGFGLVLVGVVSAVAAAAALRPDEHGVSGGLLVTTQQSGVACGLAVLLLAGGLAPGDALSPTGLRLSLLGGAVLALAGCLVLPLAARAGRARRHGRDGREEAALRTG
ncbi:MFS transporter [Streptomyces sp. NPDC093105]|uniref:MFS transporter n=1 Tax=Streptomyces sp. NPDC093105 TaxID=3366029 RepID=UPI00382D343D